MAGVGRELGDEIQMVKLVRLTIVPLLVEVEGERFLVHQDGEMTGFQHLSEVLQCFVDCQELPVVGTVFLLCRCELPGEEGKWLPGVLHALLEDGTHGNG